LIFFHHGKEIDRISGGLSESQLKNWIAQNVQSVQSVQSVQKLG
jgi:thioredoxin 2